MRKYINKFELNADYESYILSEEAKAPNIAYLVDTDKVRYKKYIENYFTIELTPTESSNSAYFAINSGNADTTGCVFEIKTNNGNWETYSLNSGRHYTSKTTIQLRCNKPWSYTYATATKSIQFSISYCSVKISGDLASLIGYQDCTPYQFYQMFTLLNNVPMDCSDLVFPSTGIANNAFKSCFYGCTGLTLPPQLPATTLASSCYYEMFYKCSALTKAPDLPATTLASSCYSTMFRGCSALTKAPDLPATTLVSGCYNSMFFGCSKITYIKCMSLTQPNQSSMVYGVAKTGTYVMNKDATWNPDEKRGNDNVPTNWTVVKE